MSEDKEKIVPANDPCADCPPDYIPDADLTPQSVELRKKCGRSYDPNAVDPNGNLQKELIGPQTQESLEEIIKALEQNL